LAKANSVIYQPGDSLLLKSGATWTGRLQPQGSGTLAERIVIDRYGGGPKTFIHGGGVSGGTVTLENAEYWTLRNLEITNTGTTEPNKMGIIVRKDCNHGRIARCRIHASSDGKSWNPIAESAFENPDEPQTVRLEIPTTDRFFKLEALQEAQNRNWTSVEEFDILLKLANH
jgi:hypothetical protein